MYNWDVQRFVIITYIYVGFMISPINTVSLKGIGTSQTSKYVFGVFTYLSYRFHTHMNNRGA